MNLCKIAFVSVLAAAVIVNAATAQDVQPVASEFADIGEGLLLKTEQHTVARVSEDNLDSQSGSSASRASVNALSISNEMAAYNKGDYKKAFDSLMPFARKGHAIAQETIALMYRLGQGVEADPVKAFEWFTRAAEVGRAISQHHIATMYFAGEGVEQDFVKAMMWILIAEKNYSDDDKKRRATEDRENIALHITRRDRDRAEAMAHDWFTQKPLGAAVSENKPAQ